ncbi:hypothetical protein AVEN_55591-1 [Araneus ventricosus]|uniref:Uncharacterized protein n=1 Tax=Araneus ventricosus TaxID=182803 RepID=A0A4Y2L1A1_ARAVE|nr:hypothetical protein AVEN_55591-1 [Araneus ventricosus]
MCSKIEAMKPRSLRQSECSIEEWGPGKKKEERNYQKERQKKSEDIGVEESGLPYRPRLSTVTRRFSSTEDNSCLTPITSLDKVSFNDQLLTSASKHTQRPEMMRHLSLEVINNVPSQALVLYTDGSKSDSGRTGSGVYAKPENGLVFHCRFRNTDNCSVFRSELLAIREALDFALRFETIF